MWDWRFCGGGWVRMRIFLDYLVKRLQFVCVCVCVCGRVVGIKVWNRLRCSFSVTGCSYHFNTTVEFSIVSRLSSTTMFHLIFVNPFGTLFVWIVIIRLCESFTTQDE